MKKEIGIYLGKHKVFKFIVCIIIISLFLPIINASALTDDEYLNAACDINGDNKVSVSDARLVLRAAVKIEILNITDAAKQAGVLKFGDLNDDSMVTTSDARILLRHCVKIETLYGKLKRPAEKPSEIPNVNNPDLDSVLKQNNLLTPYTSHGLGSAVMCEVTADFAETTFANAIDNKSNPTCSPFPKGTYDYITSSKTFGSEPTFLLSSGYRVLQKDVKNISNAYKMPLNKLSAAAVYIGEVSTDIYIKTDWTVPTNISFAPQSYYTGYDSRPWNLSEFTAEYMNIKFCHTKSGTGSFDINSYSAVKNAKWTSNSDDSVTLSLNLKEIGGVYGYSITLIDRGYFKITINHKSDSLKGKTVILDPGHGGKDSGATAGTVYEKNINLPIALKVKSILESRGATVIMTRSDDTFYELDERIALNRSSNAHIYVSLHCDSTTSSSAYGSHVFYYYPQAMPLAKSIQTALANTYKNIIYADNPNMQNGDLGVKFYPFAVARVEHCPSVLIEMGFISNITECEILQKADNQSLIAEAIADGISAYLGGYSDEEPPIEPTTAEPTTEAPTTEEPTTEEPMTEEPATEEPTTEEPTTEEPTTEEPMTEEPTIAEPTTSDEETSNIAVG